MSENDKWLSTGVVWLLMLLASIGLWLLFFRLIGVL